MTMRVGAARLVAPPILRSPRLPDCPTPRELPALIVHPCYADGITGHAAKSRRLWDAQRNVEELVMAVTQTWNAAELDALDRAHLLHPVSNLHAIQQDGPLVLTHGEDVFVWDAEGKRYIDAFAGLWNVNVGHGRTELAEAAEAQMREIAFVPAFFGLSSPPQIELATKLAELLPDPLNHFQFTSGGAESNETALKIARYY